MNPVRKTPEVKVSESAAGSSQVVKVFLAAIPRPWLVLILVVIAVGLVPVIESKAKTFALELTQPEVLQQESGDKFSEFKHDNAQHARLPCLLCHRREDNSAKPTLPGKAAHAPCAGCHSAQFSNTSSPICTICHTNVQTGSLKPFPKLRSFNVKFDHARHSGVGASCGTCHRPNRGGVSLSIPAATGAHTICFSCHTPQAQSNGKNLSSCSTCHELGKLVRTNERAAAFQVSFSHAKHDAGENLKCADCHRIRPGAAVGRQVFSPVPLNHHAPARSTSCMSCHNGTRTFGGDDFSACTKCHKGSQWRF